MRPGRIAGALTRTAYREAAPDGRGRLAYSRFVSDHPARRLWATLETIHDVVYFAPGVRDAGVGLGLRGFWNTYFAFRAAPLGAVGAEPVIACFARFEPGMMAKSLPDAWSRTTPEACLDARRSVSVDALTAAGIDESACATAAQLLAPVAASADPPWSALLAPPASAVVG